MAFTASAAASFQAKFPFSQKTGKWLRAHTLERPIIRISQPRPFEEISVDDVLAAEIARRGQETCELVLFLDRVPEGEHLLNVSTPRDRLFSLKFPKGSKRKQLPVTWEQVEALKHKFWPTKRDAIGKTTP